jgi:hypothetical protein
MKMQFRTLVGMEDRVEGDFHLIEMQINIGDGGSVR